MGVSPLFGPIPTHWSVMTLGDACMRGGGDIQTGPFGSQLHASDYVSNGTPCIMPQNIGDNRIIVDGIARISQHDVDRLSRYRVRVGDIVYSRRGDVERRALVRTQEDGWLCGTGCLRVRVGTGVLDPIYCSYYLGHPNVRSWIVRHAIGATMPNLNTSILSALPVVIPSPSEQRAIASILGSLDDKIELGRRMNATLEEMARAIYRAWFVDFEPVRAKAEGRTPESVDNATAALFPDGIEVVEGREVPRGWHVQPIGDEVDVVGGSTPSTSEPAYWEKGTIAWATPRDLSALSSPILLGTERRITEPGLRQISSGLLPKGSVLMSSRAPIGYLAITDVPVAINQGSIAMKCDRALPNYYVLLWAQTNMDAIKHRANGTTFLEISKASFRPMDILVPSPEILRAFVVAVEPLFGLMICNLKEVFRLAALRDTLLPKLLSGELRVRDAERLSEQL